MKIERLCSVIIKPLSTEKSNQVGDYFNQYVVLVRNDATKLEIKKAAEKLFDVRVKKVNVLKYKQQTRFFGRRKGKVSGYKKAYISLYPGQEMVFSEIS